MPRHVTDPCHHPSTRSLPSTANPTLQHHPPTDQPETTPPAQPSPKFPFPSQTQPDKFPTPPKSPIPHNKSFSSSGFRLPRASAASQGSGSGDVGARQGRQGAGQGRRQAPPQGAARQHPGHHQAGDPAAGAEGRREAHLRAHLRGDPRRAQDLPRERHPRRCHLHRARPPQDRHRHGRRLRAQAPGPHPLRIRRLIFSVGGGLSCCAAVIVCHVLFKWLF
ncbi:hypothetical protein HU200_033136 [Digitaria exilis]|uniref:Uncharacterized protein n=1 Tax=Digitaria exilis TaxID=1010633 RepID=A0A835BL67_9POAL|nr:hypothetical protein HU200_033136 [Digitaria exilis]